MAPAEAYDPFADRDLMRDVQREAMDMQKEIRDLESKRDSLFEAIKHGDDAHQAWLKRAIEDHFSGRVVQRP